MFEMSGSRGNGGCRVGDLPDFSGIIVTRSG